MKNIRMFILSAFILNLVTIYPQIPNSTSKVFYPSETFVYSVKWTFIRIGTITIKTNFCENSVNNIKVSMLVESNPSIPFVDIKEYNETIIDRETLMSNSFYGFYRSGGNETKYTAVYDNESKCSVWQAYDVSNQKTIDSVKIYDCPRYVDGPSLLFFTRVNSTLNKTVNVPTIIEGKIENTKIMFTNTKEAIEIDGLEYPIMSKQYFGFADWEGGSSQSLSGDFMGWISDDDAAILIYAEVKVLLGSLKIELESWERGSWNNNLKTLGAK